jgi:hypothetical protein
MKSEPPSSSPILLPETDGTLGREIHYPRTPSGQGWMRVVVNYRPVPPQGTWAGEVITAYRIDERDVKEVQLWP